MNHTAFPDRHEDLGFGTHLVDVDLYRPGLAACYVLQHGDELALIDCGTPHSTPQVLATIAALGATPEQVRWIIPTHVHLDHASGSGQLMGACSNATLVVHPKGYPHMVDPSRLQAGAMAVYGEEAFMRDFGDLQAIDESRAIAAEDGQTFDLDEAKLTFIDTPGHANHHGCIHDSASGYLFTGDTFGLGYQEFARTSADGTPYLVATTTPVAFDPDAWMQSLERMMDTHPSAVCLTHFSKHDQPEGLVPMLRDSIQAHADIALAEEPNDSEGRGERLRLAVEELLVGGAVKHCRMTEDQARQLLAGDVELNAQGLEVWLKRRAKRRAS